jgi:hypothetical protein
LERALIEGENFELLHAVSESKRDRCPEASIQKIHSPRDELNNNHKKRFPGRARRKKEKFPSAFL